MLISDSKLASHVYKMNTYQVKIPIHCLLINRWKPHRHLINREFKCITSQE